MKITPAVQAEIRSLKARGWPVKRIATKLGVSDTSVYKVLNPIKADRVRAVPEQYKDTPQKAAIRQLSSEIAEIRDNLMKRRRRLANKLVEISKMDQKITELEALRAYHWKKHKESK